MIASRMNVGKGLETTTMKTLLALLGCSALGAAQEAASPKPSTEHAWLQPLEGEWSGAGEGLAAPDQPPVKTKGAATGRSLGGFWILLECRGDVAGAPFTGLLTLGYDAAKKKYVGSWVDSMTATQWRYEGSLDEAGKLLTLETEGLSPLTGKLEKFRETIERKDKDAWILRSSIQADGKWVEFLKMSYTRKEK